MRAAGLANTITRQEAKIRGSIVSKPRRTLSLHNIVDGYGERNIRGGMEYGKRWPSGRRLIRERTQMQLEEMSRAPQLLFDRYHSAQRLLHDSPYT